MLRGCEAADYLRGSSGMEKVGGVEAVPEGTVCFCRGVKLR